MARVNRPLLAGDVEVMVGDQEPERGVALSLCSNAAVVAWLTPEQANKIALSMIEASISVAEARKRQADERGRAAAPVKP